jgi:small subunit ribosomal protein S19e
VPYELFIQRLSSYLRVEYDPIKPTSWAQFAKTSAQKERAPQDPNWWYIRTASILRKIYVNGPIGVARLKSQYGGRKSKSSKPYHKYKGGGSIIRKVLQQLEESGLIEQKDSEGRVVTSKGEALLDSLASEIKGDLEKEIPELKKY